MKNLLQSLDRPIAFQRSFVRLTGSITAALFLSQAIYWTLRSSTGDGWFYKTQPGWEAETGMTRREQDSARKLLRETGILQEEKRGMPAKIWFRVDEEKLASCLAECANQAWRKAPTTAGGKRQPLLGTESTAESTAETTQQIQKHAPPLQAPVKIEKSEPNPEDAAWRAGWNGVLEDLHRALVVNQPKAVLDRLRGDEDWRLYFAQMVCEGVDRRGGCTGPLVLRVPNATTAKQGLVKYHKRIHAGMQKYFGKSVRVVLIDSS